MREIRKLSPKGHQSAIISTAYAASIEHISTRQGQELEALDGDDLLIDRDEVLASTREYEKQAAGFRG